MIKPFFIIKGAFQGCHVSIESYNDALYFYIHLKKLLIGIHKKKNAVPQHSSPTGKTSL